MISFNENVQVHHMVCWKFAYRESRRGPWEQFARDRNRFKKRTAELASIINPVVINKIEISKMYKYKILINAFEGFLLF